MILEACAANCFSWTFVLKFNDRPIGKFEGQWFSENLGIQLTERRRLAFRKIAWLGSRFELADLNEDRILCDCDRAGLLTSAWDVRLSTGVGQLVRTGWFDTAYEFIQAGLAVARVDRVGWCDRGWIVDGGGELSLEDHLFLGLVYYTIQKRQQQHPNAGGAAGL